VWNLESGAELRSLAGHTASARAVAVTPDGGHAVSASDDQTLKVWDLESGAALRTLAGHTAPVNAVAVTPDGERAVSTSDDGTLKLWDLDSGQIIARFGGDGRLTACVVVPDGGECGNGLIIVAGEASGRVHFMGALYTFGGSGLNPRSCGIRTSRHRPSIRF
jgi:WD40 repeat protein